jgi:hypothetical protein
MKAAVWRVAGKVADTIREMNEAQRRMLVLRTAPDRYIVNRGNVAPDTYDEFLARTSGWMLHEPSARQRAQKKPARG